MQLALLLRGGSWDGVTASLLVSKTSLWPRPSAIDLLGRTLPAGVSKADAQLTIMLAYSQMRSTSLRREDRIQYLEAIIQVYDALHLIRRKAAIQRELAVLVSTGVTTEKVQATEMDLAADVTTLQPAPTRKLEGHLTGNEKVIETLQSVCRAYGLPDATNERNCTPSVLPSKNVMSLLETVFNHFGWLEIQYAIVREGVRVSDLLPGECRRRQHQ